MSDGWTEFLKHCPSWQCTVCGYWNGGLMSECMGKVGCTGRIPLAKQEG